MIEETDNENAKTPNPAFEPTRVSLDIQVGSFVRCNDAVYRISQVLDFESAIGVEVESGRSAPLRIGELRPVAEVKSADMGSHRDLADIADEDWKVAEQRFAAIKPLLHEIFLGRIEVERRAKEVGVNVATLYRWLHKYKAIGVVSALISKKRGWKEGKSRIPVFTDQVIEGVIKDFYLTTQRPTATKAVTEVLRRCQQRGIDAPHPTTIRARLAKVTEKERLRGRGFKEKAKETPIKSSKG